MSEDTEESRKIELQVPATASAGTRLKYVLVNNSARGILTGSGFGLDVEGADGWESVNRTKIFTAVGIIVEPGQSREFVAPLPDDLPAGEYRLRKSFRWSLSRGGPPPFEAAATLCVTNPGQRGHVRSRG